MLKQLKKGTMNNYELYLKAKEVKKEKALNSLLKEFQQKTGCENLSIKSSDFIICLEDFKNKQISLKVNLNEGEFFIDYEIDLDIIHHKEVYYNDEIYYNDLEVKCIGFESKNVDYIEISEPLESQEKFNEIVSDYFCEISLWQEEIREDFEKYGY